MDKTGVACMKERATDEVKAKVVSSTDAATLRSFLRGHAKAEAAIRTGKHGAMGRIAAGPFGKRPRYRDSAAAGLRSGART